MDPLRFQPLFRSYLWGGRRLATVLKKPLPPEGIFAESWEIVDHGEDQSRVLAGPYADWTLHQLMQSHAVELMGAGWRQPQFPWLFKFLDAHQSLSVQVHPNDAQASKLTPPDLGKTEAWVILEAEPGSVLYAGLKVGIDAATFRASIQAGTVKDCLYAIQPSPGDCIFLPAGTVHALGAGLLVAELQQSSDTTYRVFDWNRVGPDGKPRQLHIEEAFQVIDFEAGPVEPRVPADSLSHGVETLVRCDKFHLQRCQLLEAATFGGDGQLVLLAVTSGEATLSHDATGRPLRMGETAIIPASSPVITLTPQPTTTLLQARLPV